MTSTPLDPLDPRYPTALAGLTAPPVLYLRGALPVLPGVTMVGTRAATEAALDFTRTLAAELALAGLSVWSGGALGIDAAAHEGALDAGGVTVVIAGGGLDRPYPKEHVPLFDRVLASGGALLARAPDEAPPTPRGFILRNELLAALTVVTVVVEAGLRSGARSTAAAARRLGRPLCIVPHAPWDPRGAGCALELARGARAVTRASDVIDAVLALGPAPSALVRTLTTRASAPKRAPASPRTPASPRAPASERDERRELDTLDEESRAILAAIDAIGPAAAHLDEICERAARTPQVIMASLLTLTLRAVVVEGPPGFFRRVRHT